MSAKPRAGSVRGKYEFIKTHRGEFSTQVMCRVLGVAPSGYYDWLQHPLSNRAIEDARLLRLLQASFTASRGIYGAPRVFLDLRETGETCSKHRVERLMRENSLRARHRYRTRRWSVGKPARLDPEPPPTAVHGHAVEQSLGNRHHVPSHVAGLALLGGGDRFVLAEGRRMGHRPHRPPRVGAECRAVGDTQPATPRHADPLRSGNAVRQRCLAPVLPW